MKGVAADRAEGTVTIDRILAISVKDKSEQKVEISGDEMGAQRFLGVKSLKMVPGSCK